jgi:hypothetical protein
MQEQGRVKIRPPAASVRLDDDQERKPTAGKYLRQASEKEEAQRGTLPQVEEEDKTPCVGCKGRVKVRMGSPPQVK